MLLSDFLKFLELNRKQDYEVHYIDKEGNEVESYFIDLDTEVKEFKYCSSYRYEEGSMSYEDSDDIYIYLGNKNES